MSSLTTANIAAFNAANNDLTPSTFARHGSRSSPSASSASSLFTDHPLLQSLHSRGSSWFQHIWARRTIRLERISVGKVALGSKVLTIEEMKAEMAMVPEVTGFEDCLPVAEGGAFVGWRLKGATFPRVMDV